jgi:ABC-type nitrate/sulfonate/bicarbonate transport system substrate-binding protein
MTQSDPPLLSIQLEKGDVDAVFTFSNLGSQLVSQGKGRILFVAADLLNDVYGLTKDEPFGVYMTTPDIQKKNSDVIRRYLSAYKESLSILLNDDSIWPALAKTQNITADDAVKALRDTEKQSFTAQWDAPALNHFGQLFDALYKIGGKQVTGVDKFDPSLYTLDLWPK